MCARVESGELGRPKRKKSRKKLTNTIDEGGRGNGLVSNVPKRIGWVKGGREKKKIELTDITQDGTDEGRLNDTELAFDEGKDLRNRVSRRRDGRTRYVLRTATISSTLRVVEARQDVEAIKTQPQCEAKKITHALPCKQTRVWVSRRMR